MARDAIMQDMVESIHKLVHMSVHSSNDLWVVAVVNANVVG